MSLERITTELERPLTLEWLERRGVVNLERGLQNLRSISLRVPPPAFVLMSGQLGIALYRLSDPDMALNNLDRFVQAALEPLALVALFERDTEALSMLLQIFSGSQYLGDLLVHDPEEYALLRQWHGEPVSRDELTQNISAEVLSVTNPREIPTALRRYKRRETLGIGYSDMIRGLRLETVTKQISYLADALIEAAVRTARVALEQKHGIPRDAAGQPARFVVLALGKLGGLELNYSSDIDLMFLYSDEGTTDGSRKLVNSEFFSRLVREVVRLLTESSGLGIVYRVDLRLRPGGESAQVVTTLDAALNYYDLLGRTWERQAFVKARAVAGDLELGQEFLARLEPWIYRRYLSRADISGIRALKRRIEQRAEREGGEATNVKTGRGGIRDIEFVIQFLQLLNGGDLPAVRTTNTLEAIVRLENAGCLTNQERSLLGEHYTLLRQIEHRLQIMFDLQTHTLPCDPAELRRLALRLGYTGTPTQPPLGEFTAEYQRITELNRKILDHLLHDAFPGDENSEPEVDLVLDPAPEPERICTVLARHNFRDVQRAYDDLMSLAEEKIRFLSPRRCRHFLAAIAPRLLTAIATRADPDTTLRNLAGVSDSLGGKAVLWELFNFNPPSLELYVDLCASSPFLCDVLTKHPGMIDELLDSLLVDKLPTLAQLQAHLAELTRRAADPLPSWHSFLNAEKLRVGIRDILNKEPVEQINAALSNIAETVVEHVAATTFDALVAKFGEPNSAGALSANTGDPAELLIVALGKFGGAELNYHSDLDLLFLYTADGGTFHRGRRSPRSAETTSNQHFFSEQGQRLIKLCGEVGPQGRLYEVDPRLRPTGKSGRLATSLAEFLRYFQSGEGQLWERQALCRARVITGSPAARAAAMETIHRAQFAIPWRPEFAREIYDMRLRMQEDATEWNLKRAAGGVVDIEFLVQLLQLKHGAELPSLRQPNTIGALDALRAAGILSPADWDYLSTSYQVLRSIQGRLRLMNMSALNDLPTQPEELSKLAQFLGYPDRDKLLADCRELQAENRARLERVVRES